MGLAQNFLGASKSSKRLDLFKLVLIWSFACITLTISDPRATEAALICTNRTALATERTPFVANFLASLDAVTPLVSSRRFAGVVNGSEEGNKVFTFGECMKDLSQADCDQCFAQCKTQILRCLPFQRLVRGGRLFYDGCYLRYDDYSFFNESVSVVDRTVCGNVSFGGGNVSEFGESVVRLMRNLSYEAVGNDGFKVGRSEGRNGSVFGLVQCWEGVSMAECGRCLGKAVANVSGCTPKEEGRVLRAGCYMRYSTKKFYDNSTVVAAVVNGG